MRLTALLAHAAALALLLACAPARAETTACTVVASVPTILSTGGHYCLTADFAAAGASTVAITVRSSEVVLDCNGHRLSAATADNTGAGVHIEGTAYRATVRNCVIDGFYYGISAAYAAAAQPRGAHLVGNRVSRALAGIFLYGSNNLVEGNTISDGQRFTSGYPTGIYMLGGDPGDFAAGNVVRGNVIHDFHPSTPTDGSYNLSIGIQATYQSGMVIEDNTITGLQARTGGGTYGIVTGNAREVEVRGNRVLSSTPGPAPFDGGSWSGIFLQGTAEETGSCNCTDNLVGHFNSNYNGCSATSNTSF